MSVVTEEDSVKMLDTTGDTRPVSDDGPAPRPAKLIGVRHLQVFLMFLGWAVAYGMRVNLSVGIVAMTDRNSTGVDFPEYQWDANIKGNLLSSFFWGYVITQIPAGQLAQRFGPKIVLTGSLFVCSVFTLLIPVAAEVGDWGLLCGTRVIQGLAQGFIMPCLQNLLSNWTPTEERGTLATIVYTGAQLGTIIAMPVSGALASSSIGWPSIFYTFGAAGILWVAFWFFLAADRPGTHKFISKEEQAYIETNLGSKVSTDTKRQTPWVDIFTSLPIWAVIIAQCAFTWGFFTLLTEIPSYMNSILKFDLKSNGLLSALPYLVMWLLSFVFSWTSDFVNKKHIVSLGTSRKVFNSIGLWGPGLFLLGLNFISTEDATAAVVLLTLAVGVNSAIYVGLMLNQIDLSPNYAGTISGITNCMSNIMSIFAPMLVGLIVTNENDESQWHIVFYIASGVYFTFNLFFVIFGKAKIQPWNNTDAPREKELCSIGMKETDAKDTY